MSVLSKSRRVTRHDMDMTQGSIVRNILLFAFPLLVGNLFQQLYNMVDAWVVSKTGITEAYAAVGSVGPIINILIGFFVGLSSGTSVLVSQYYGAKKNDKIHETVHTAIGATLVMGVIFTFVGIVMTPLFLDLMLHGEKSDVYPYAEKYLIIYFSGIMGMMLYNMAAGILRAVGDSKRPFYFLVVSSVLNVVLDLFFVFGLNMNVDGVAYATIISQWTSAVLAIICLLKNETCVKLIAKDIRISGSMLKKIVLVGFPAGLQMAITAFSNVFVQSYITNVNGNTTNILAGWTSYSKIDMFMFLPAQSIGLAVTTFVGQNTGIGNHKRSKRGTWLSVGVSACITSFLIVVVMIFAPYLVKIFSTDSEVVYYGAKLLVYLSPFYILTCVNQTIAASLRGMGNTTAPMIIMLSSFVGFRQVYLYVISNYVSNELLPVAYGYPAGWFVCACTITLYYTIYIKKKQRQAL